MKRFSAVFFAFTLAFVSVFSVPGPAKALPGLSNQEEDICENVLGAAFMDAANKALQPGFGAGIIASVLSAARANAQKELDSILKQLDSAEYSALYDPNVGTANALLLQAKIDCLGKIQKIFVVFPRENPLPESNSGYVDGGLFTQPQLTELELSRIALTTWLAVALSTVAFLPGAFYLTGGLGATFPLQNTELSPFTQAAEHSPSLAGMFGIGMILSVLPFLGILPKQAYLAGELRFVGGQVQNDRLVNINAAGFLNTTGQTRFFGVLAVLMAIIPLHNRWNAKLGAGLGVANSEFSMFNAAGTRIGHASGTPLMWQLTGGLEYELKRGVKFGVETTLTGLDAIVGSTNTNVPFELQNQINLATMLTLTVELGRAKNF